MGNLIDNSSGEILNTKFIKLMYEDIGKLFGLTAASIKLLIIMMRDCQYGNKINMTPKRKKVYVKELLLASQNSLNGVLKKLEIAGVVQREEEGSTYYILNPSICFKGNDYQHAKVLMTYNKDGRTIEVLT